MDAAHPIDDRPSRQKEDERRDNRLECGKTPGARDRTGMVADSHR